MSEAGTTVSHRFSCLGILFAVVLYKPLFLARSYHSFGTLLHLHLYSQHHPPSMALKNPFSVIIQYLWWKRYKKQTSATTNSSNDTPSSSKTGKEAIRPARRSPRTSSKHRNARHKTSKAGPNKIPKLSAAAVRAKITHHLEKLHNELVEVVEKLQKHREDCADADLEYEELNKALEDMNNLMHRESEIYAEQKQYLGWLFLPFPTRKPRMKKTTPNVGTQEHSLAAKRRRDQEAMVQRALYRQKLAKNQADHADTLHYYIQGEIKIQEQKRDEAEEVDDGELDFNEDLADVLEEERVLRQMARQKEEEEEEPDRSPTTDRVYYPLLPPGWRPSSRVFHAAQMPRQQTPFRKPRGPSLESMGACLNIPVASRKPQTDATTHDPREHFRGLSLAQPPTAPYCRSHMWAPKANEGSITCDRCGTHVSKSITFCCTKCRAEICQACFQKAQPEGAEMGVSNLIFSTGDHKKG